MKTMKKNLTICITTDVHGTLQTISYADGKDKAQGLSRYLTALKQFRLSEDVLCLDNGDILQGSPLLTYFQNKPRAPHILSQALNMIRVNYFNLGNHDFNYGKPILKQFLSDLKAPCLTQNILLDGKPFGHSYIYVSKQGIKVGIIGVCTDYIPHWEKPSHIEGMVFQDPIEVVKKELMTLKPQVDYMIVMYHGGLERDPISGVPTEPLTRENVGYELSQLKGIDLLITGHQHRSIITKINNTFVTQCASNAQEFVKVNINFENGQLQSESQLIKMKEFLEDQDLLTLIKPWEDETQVWLNQVVGHLHGHDYLIKDPFKARLCKHPLVSLINTIQLEVSKAQLSGVSLFNDPTGFKPVITYRDIVSTYVYPNTLVVKEVTGTVLKAYLEKCAEYFMVKNGEIIVNPEYDEPKAQHFNYDMVDGIEYTLKISNPIGQRLIDCAYNGKAIQSNDIFSLVINNYRANGGGNFDMIVNCPTLSEINTDMTDIMASYFEAHSDLHPSHTENILVMM
jgi:2',3'-cyclic-nucleotide 2'-phosphodiesterase / 3'-nucleotidase